MISLTGFYNGTSVIPLENVELKQNQKVIITVLDEFVDLGRATVKKNSFFGILKKQITGIADDFDETPADFKDYI